MASMMQRITVGELLELLMERKDEEFIGHLFSVKQDLDAPEHQVLVFFEPIKPM